jgi:hypothetical protein
VNARGRGATVSIVQVAWVVFAVVLGASGCGSQSSNKRTEYFSLHTSTSSNQIGLSETGHLIGPNLQLAPTDNGYRGMAASSLVDLRSDGEHIMGTINDRVVDLHVKVSPDGLTCRGMFGGRLGRLEATNTGITSNLGFCSYELEAKGTRYEGQRACSRGGMSIPVVRPAIVELPPGFERLRPDRQAMLLALLLQ